MGRIILVPTSHIAEESIRNVRETVDKEKPQCIAVEMDLNRFFAMREGNASSWEAVKSLGISTFLVYFLMKKLQEWLGKKVGILPGSEMLEAVKIGESQALTIAFIDRDIRITFARLKEVSRREKFKLIWFILKGVSVGFVASKIKKQKTIDLRKVPPKEIIKEALTVIKKEFPSLYKILIRERDIYMAEKLKQLSGKFETIVAVVGAGHYDALQKLLKNKIQK